MRKNCNKLLILKSQRIQICKNICKILKPEEKLKMCKISFKGVWEKFCAKFVCKIVQSDCFCYGLSTVLYNIEIQ